MRQLRRDVSALALGFCLGSATLYAAQVPPRPTPVQTPRPTPRPGQPGRLTMAATGEIQHLTRQQAQVACLIGWTQGVGSGAPNEVATVMAYIYLAETDAAAGTASGGHPLVAQCAGVTGPFQCQSSFVLPPAGQTIGSHTLSLSASDQSGQTGTTTIQYIVDPDVFGPPPAPAGLRFIGGLGGGPF